jgi:phospholipase C
MLRQFRDLARPTYALITFAFCYTLFGCGGGLSSSPPKSDQGGGTVQGGTPPPVGSLNTSVNHIILFMQGNRSFDEYFGQLDAYRASKGLSTEVDDLSKANNVALPSWDASASNIAPFKMNSACTGDLSSSWVEAHIDVDMHHPSSPGTPPPMDGFAYEAGGFAAHNPAGDGDAIGQRAMGYYDASQLTFYYWAATQFGTSDRWFSAAPARTQINACTSCQRRQTAMRSQETI